MLGLTREEILEEARNNGFFVRRGIDMSREDFVRFCNFIGTPWNEKIHKIHGETFDSDQIVDWSNKTRFKGASLPWHADNPYHPDYKLPLRAFYAKKIPHPDKDIIWFLNITKWFEDLSEEKKNYFRNLQVLTQDYKGNWQPYWSSLVKIHPITGKESFYWGAMAIKSDVFGVECDEGLRFPHFSYTMAVQHPDRKLISHDEINSWFSDMINEKYLYGHNWQEGDVLIMDNWISLHYIGSQNYSEERLLWRKTILQPWQKFIG